MINNIQGSDIELIYPAVILCYSLLIFCIKYFVIDKKFTDIEAFYLGIIMEYTKQLVRQLLKIGVMR